MAMAMHLKKGIFKMTYISYKYKKMTFKEAEQIIANIVEAAFLNARDIDEEEAKEIDQASEIYFEKVNNLLNKEIDNDKTK